MHHVLGVAGYFLLRVQEPPFAATFLSLFVMFSRGNGTSIRITIDLTAFIPFKCCGLYKVHNIIHISLKFQEIPLYQGFRTCRTSC